MRLDMLQRVHAFSQQHTAEIQGYVEAVRALSEKLARAEVLAAQQESGDLAAEGSKVRKDALREVIEQEYVVHLVRIARVALPNDPELHRRFRRPRRGLNRQEFVGAVQAMLAEAASRKATFVAEGMADTFVEDVERLLTQYLEAITQKGLGEAQRVAAVAELPEITKEMMQVLRRLDAINRKRWQKSPELLAAWRSAKDVTWPHVKPVAQESEPGRGKGGKEHAA